MHGYDRCKKLTCLQRWLAGGLLLLISANGCELDGAEQDDDPHPKDAGTVLSPTWSTEFVRNDAQWWPLTLSPDTRVDFGVTDPAADDNAVAVLTFPGDTTLTSTDRVGPGYAAEISTQRDFKYGTFRARLQPARCQPNEEVVNGFFVYFNDGKDDNGNGLIDNSEIDIEILCGEPQFISLTSWTDYEEDPERFLKWTRVIDTAKGAYAESSADNSYGLGSWVSAPELQIPGFPAPNTFYEMGFEWHSTSLRFFIVVNGREITLWNGPAAKYIPQRATPLIFNLWHTNAHWVDGGTAAYPTYDAQLRIDWVRYWGPTDVSIRAAGCPTRSQPRRHSCIRCRARRARSQGRAMVDLLI